MLRDPSTHHLGQMKIDDFFPHTFFTTLEMRKKSWKIRESQYGKTGFSQAQERDQMTRNIWHLHQGKKKIRSIHPPGGSTKLFFAF